LKTLNIRKYSTQEYQQWNTFVEHAKNGTFLFHRDFMEYHSDRFEDFSLMIFEGDKLIALFPANKDRNQIHSHQGLTYGGILLPDRIGGKKVNEIFNEVLRYLKDLKIEELKVKSIPVFYHKNPANELNFFLHEAGGQLYRSDLNLAIDYSQPLAIHKSKLKHFERRKDLGLVINQVDDFSEFWDDVLVPRLLDKHGVQPVHTKEEIMLLKKRFPQQIIQYTVSLEGSILAGITIFKTKTVVKSQYGAVTKQGENHRALDYLFISLIQKFKKEGIHFFDMGTVTENNYGLLKQKEELGCSIYSQDFYRLNI